MKFGRVAGHELETLCAALKKILSRKATHSAAFILAPYLVSDRVLHGIRGEVRLEDKLDAKGVMSYADWKKGSAIFSSHRAYDPEVSVSQNLNVTDYPMKFVSVSVDSFNVTPLENAVVAAPSDEPEEELPMWEGEPPTLNDLINTYNVECKLSSSFPEATLYLVDAKPRSGNSSENVVEGQTQKLFLVAHMPMTLDNAEPIIGHGKCSYMKEERATPSPSPLEDDQMNRRHRGRIVEEVKHKNQDSEVIPKDQPEALEERHTRGVPVTVSTASLESAKNVSKEMNAQQKTETSQTKSLPPVTTEAEMQPKAATSEAETKSKPKPLPSTSSSLDRAANPLLDPKDKQKLEGDIAEARQKMKEDKNAAKNGDKPVRRRLLPELAPGEEGEMVMEEVEELEEDSESTTLVLGQEPKRRGKAKSEPKSKAADAAASKPEAKSKAKAKSAAAFKKPAAKAKAKPSPKKVSRAMKAKKVAKGNRFGKRGKNQKEPKGSTPSEPKGKTSSESEKKSELSMMSVFHSHLRETIAKLKEEGMPAKEALAHARSSEDADMDRQQEAEMAEPEDKAPPPVDDEEENVISDTDMVFLEGSDEPDELSPLLEFEENDIMDALWQQSNGLLQLALTSPAGEELMTVNLVVRALKLGPLVKKQAIDEFSSLQERLNAAQKRLNPFKSVRQDYERRAQARKLYEELSSKLAGAEIEVEKAAMMTAPMGTDSDEGMKETEATLTLAQTMLAQTNRQVEAKLKQLEDVDFGEQLKGLLERCKLAQEKLDDLRSILRETQVRLAADLLMKEVSDKVANAEDEIQKMAEAELPFLRNDKDQDMSELFAEADKVAAHVHGVLAETQSYVARKSVEVSKFSDGPGEAVKEEAEDQPQQLAGGKFAEEVGGGT
ncbi:unnamed protein product [Durusdinium trenchii]|uniref:Uncharacterized protein n=1 Tax=Durusdinium trenchii TaxID=1381693 RepID=A0ABP0NIS3_9DINO